MYMHRWCNLMLKAVPGPGLPGCHATAFLEVLRIPQAQNRPPTKGSEPRIGSSFKLSLDLQSAQNIAFILT